MPFCDSTALPALSAHYLDRDKLNTAFAEHQKFQITVLEAPSGYGKSSFIANQVQKSSTPTAWVNLEKRDNSASRFCNSLIHAFAATPLAAGRKLQAFINSTPDVATNKIIDMLIEELKGAQRSWQCPANVWLVLDNFHVIDNQDVLEHIDRLLDHLPAYLHCIIISHTIPQISFTHRYGLGAILHLRTNQFAFSFDETRTLVQSRLVSALSENQIRQLQLKTEGWPGAIQLLISIVQQHPDFIAPLLSHPVKHHLLANYLAENFLSKQSPAFIENLAYIAQLSRFNGPLLQAVFGKSQGIRLWQEIEESNGLLLPTDITREWYKLHPLITDWLNNQSLTRPEINQAYLQKSAQFFLDQEMYLDAFTIAIAQQNWALVTGITEKAAPELFRNGKYQLAEELISHIPRDKLNQHPQLSLIHILVERHKEGVESAQPLIESLQKRLKIAEETQESAAFNSQEWLTTKALINMVEGDLCRNIGQFEKARQLTEASAILLQDDNTPFSAWILNGLGTDQLLRGNMNEAYRLLTRSLQVAQKNFDGLCFLATICWLGPLLVHRGQLESGLQLLRSWEKWVQDNGFNSLPLSSAIERVRAMLYREMGNLKEAKAARERMQWALEELDPLNKLYSKFLDISISLALPEVNSLKQAIAEFESLHCNYYSSWHLAIPNIVCFQGIASLRSGNPIPLATWVMGFPANSDPTNYLRYIAEENLFIRANVGLGKDMSEQIHRIQQEATDSGNNQRFVYSFLLHTLNSLGQKKDTTALKFLCRTLTEAENFAFIQMLIDEKLPLQSLWPKLPSNVKSLEVVKQLDLIFNNKETSKDEDQQTPENISLPNQQISPLSQRENEVLSLIAEGRSNTQIAESLNISQTTVKSHLRNIYGKLKVSRRTQAIAAAQAHKWI